MEGVKESMKEECKRPMQVSRLSEKIQKGRGQRYDREENVNVLAVGRSSMHSQQLLNHQIPCPWPYLQVSWVQLTNVSTEVFMGHAAPFQEVRYL